MTFPRKPPLDQATKWRRAIAFTLALVLVSASSATAERILIPLLITYPTPGDHGAVWDTTLAIWNTSDDYWPSVWPVVGCTYSDELWIAPHATEIDPICTNSGAGAILTVPDAIAEKVRFHLSLFNRASSCLSAGTEIPVVRERQFLSGPSSILGIPGSPDLRRTVRIFNLTPSKPFVFRLRVFLIAEEEPFLDFSATVPAPTPPGLGNLIRLDDGTAFPDMSYGDLKFELTPDDPSLKYWWFASVASIETNSVSVLTPQ